MEVVDGQHRLQACEILEIPVAYVVEPGLTTAVAQLMNALQKTWTIEDFARSYSLSGNENYRLLLDLYEEYRMPMTVLVTYIHGNRYKTLEKDFRRGNFQMPEDKVGMRDRLDKLQEFEMHEWFNTGTFALAALGAMRNPNVNFDRLAEAYKSASPVRRSTRLDYLRDMERAYNYGKRTT